MITIGDAIANFETVVNGLEPMILGVMKDSRDSVVDYVIDHLHSGLNGREKPIRPDYLHDPWFNTKESGSWYKGAYRYMKWKEKIRPPASAPSYLGYAPRDSKTPNLIIRGDFYDSITAIPIPGGLRIETQGTSFGADVERKYGSIILGVGDKGKSHFVRYILTQKLVRYLKG